MSNELLSIGTHVECVAHNGAHVGKVVHHIGAEGYGISWDDRDDEGRVPRGWPHVPHLLFAELDVVIEQRMCCTICVKPAERVISENDDDNRRMFKCPNDHVTRGIPTEERRHYCQVIAEQQLT